MNITSSIF